MPQAFGGESTISTQNLHGTGGGIGFHNSEVAFERLRSSELVSPADNPQASTRFRTLIMAFF